MRIYLAGRYQEQKSMRRLRAVLVTNGHEITSRWIDGQHDGVAPELCARDDLDDIDAAEMLLLVNPQALHGRGRGGRHVEVGYALGKGLLVMIYGDPENVFHYLPSVRVVATLDELIASLP